MEYGILIVALGALFACSSGSASSNRAGTAASPATPEAPAPAPAPAPAQPGKASDPTPIAGGLFLIPACNVINANQPGSAQTTIGCNVQNNDGSLYTGTVANLAASVYANGQSKPAAGTVQPASAGGSYQYVVIVSGITPTEARTITLNGLFNGVTEQLSGFLSHDLQFTTGPIDLYVDAAAASANAFCTKAAPCTTINKAMSMVPQALYDPVKVHIAAGAYAEVINISGQTAGGSAGTGGLTLIGEASGFTETAADCNSAAGVASCFQVTVPPATTTLLRGAVVVSGFLNQSSGATVFQLRNARITGNGSATANISNGIFLNAQSSASLQNVTIENVATNGIAAESGAYLQLNSAAAPSPIPNTITHPGSAGLAAWSGAAVDVNGALTMALNAGATGILVDGSRIATTYAGQAEFSATVASTIQIMFDDASAGVGVQTQDSGTFLLDEFDPAAANSKQSALTISGSGIAGAVALDGSNVTLYRATVSIQGLTPLQAENGGEFEVETAASAAATDFLDLSLSFPTAATASTRGGLALYLFDTGKAFFNGNVKVHLCGPSAAASSAVDINGTSVQPVVEILSASILSASFNPGFGIASDAAHCGVSAANQIDGIAIGPTATAEVGPASDPASSSNVLVTSTSLNYTAPL